MLDLEKYLLTANEIECQGDAYTCINALISNPQYTNTYYTEKHMISLLDKSKWCSECWAYYGDRTNPAQYFLANHIHDYHIIHGKTKEDRPFLMVDFQTKTRADMLSHFKCNAESFILMNDRFHNPEELKRVVTIWTVHSDPVLFIYLDQPNLPNEITFSVRKHYFQSDPRNEFIKKGVVDRNITYFYGMANYDGDTKYNPSKRILVRI